MIFLLLNEPNPIFEPFLLFQILFIASVVIACWLLFDGCGKWFSLFESFCHCWSIRWLGFRAKISRWHLFIYKILLSFLFSVVVLFVSAKFLFFLFLKCQPFCGFECNRYDILSELAFRAKNAIHSFNFSWFFTFHGRMNDGQYQSAFVHLVPFQIIYCEFLLADRHFVSNVWNWIARKKISYEHDANVS